MFSTGGNAFPIPWMKASTGGNAPAIPLLIGYLHAGAKRPSRHGIVADHVVRLVAQVHDFGLQAEGALPQLERSVGGELLLGVARDEVLRHVLRQRVTVAHRRERPAEVQPACFQRGCDRPGVFCRIGNLVAIYFRAALGAVCRVLPCIGSVQSQGHIERKAERGGQVHVEAENIDPPHVHHLPYKHRWDGHNLVAHVVVVSVHREAHVFEREGGERVVPRCAEVVLRRLFRFQILVPDAVVIEVVERRRAENVLIRRAEAEMLRGPDEVRKAGGRGEAVPVVGRFTHFQRLRDVGPEE